METNTKYPIVLVHGVGLKEYKIFKAFGKIEKKLIYNGFDVSTATTDAFGTIENNAEQLKKFVDDLLVKKDAEKVNVIAHSKGGLDTRYMIDRLGMSSKVASVTFLCTPHKGSRIATKLYDLPKPIKGFISFCLTSFYKLFGDENPQVLEVCRQLRFSDEGALETFNNTDGIYMQSFSTNLKRSKDDFVMGIPLYFSKKYENDLSDGLVSQKSSIFGEYKGECIQNESISHSEIVDFMTGSKKKEKVYGFYVSLCQDLAEKGF